MAVEKSTIKISGLNKDLVGRAAAEIRSLKKPEPYKGKGIHYQGEVIRRKVGKKAAATGRAHNDRQKTMNARKNIDQKRMRRAARVSARLYGTAAHAAARREPQQSLRLRAAY